MAPATRGGLMASETFKKRQKEVARREKKQKKIARLAERRSKSEKDPAQAEEGKPETEQPVLT
jgi:hypothetical protein